MGRRYQNVAAAEEEDEERQQQEQEQQQQHAGAQQEAEHADSSDRSPTPAAAAEEQHQQQQHIGELPRNSSSSDGIFLDDNNKDHHPIPKRKLAYTVTLVVALWVIEYSTATTVFRTVAQHEPSVRIFRALLEACLLLACAAASIATWTRYLGHDATATLLFQPASAQLLSESSSSGAAAGGFLGTVLGGESAAAAAPATVHHGGDGHSTSDDDEDDDDDSDEAIVESQADEEDEENSHNITIIEDTSLRVPSPWLVLSAALDLLVWILVALVLYTVTAVHAVLSDDSKNNLGRWLSRVAAPTFPLLLFVVVVVRIAVHRRRSARPILQIVSFTLSAPFLEVTFRDGMIGDVLTSVVRPMQDIAFTVFYILFGLRGWYSNSYFFPDAAQTERQFITEQEESVLGGGGSGSSPSFVDAADANVPAMEQSWIVHTVVLPACMISPLWWRFLQNMRQVYDAQQRWPYLGNALKYFCAASVAMTGVYHPHLKSSPLWLSCFVLATLYQVCVCPVLLVVNLIVE